MGRLRKGEESNEKKFHSENADLPLMTFDHTACEFCTLLNLPTLCLNVVHLYILVALWRTTDQHFGLNFGRLKVGKHNKIMLRAKPLIFALCLPAIL